MSTISIPKHRIGHITVYKGIFSNYNVNNLNSDGCMACLVANGAEPGFFQQREEEGSEEAEIREVTCKFLVEKTKYA